MVCLSLMKWQIRKSEISFCGHLSHSEMKLVYYTANMSFHAADSILQLMKFYHLKYYGQNFMACYCGEKRKPCKHD